MNAFILQHVPFEGPAMIADILAERGWDLQVVRLYDGAAVPKVSDMDLLVLMGGPMSVNDEDDYPWLRPEKALIREAIAERKAILGVCLGAQLIASALGAKVYKNPEKEIGWWPVLPITPPPPDAFAFPPDLVVFHWHGETFDLPEGAVHLARSDACNHQAFQVGRRVIALQFHLETTPESAQRLVEHARPDMTQGRFVQSESDLLSATERHCTACRTELTRILDYTNR